jgi:YbbR domain-containing protein
MLRRLARNLPTFFLAFILALAVWVMAVIATDPDVTQSYPTPISIEFVGQDPSLIMTGTVTRQVQVTLRAPRSIWNQFTSGKASIRAVADLTGLGSGTHAVEVQVQIATRLVRIISVTPQTLKLSLEPLVTQTLPIELTLTGEPAIGYKIGAIVLDPAEAVISGPESIVTQAKHVQAILDVTNARQSIETTRPISVITENGAALSGITIHPDSVKVDLPLAQQGGYRDLAVKAVTVGNPASGYWVKNVTASLPVVTVYSGNLSLIESLPGYVETMPLDLSGASDNIETKLALNLPSGVTLIGDQTVSVQVEIVPIEGSRPVAFLPVEVIGLAAGLKSQLSPTTVDVILSGPLSVLESLSSSDVHVKLDLTGLTSGTYQLTPTVTVDKQGVTVQSILPGTVEVILTKEATPTPRPTPTPTPTKTPKPTP